jgi:aryl-alcohol dehydrogenase-like predicted oxidoreductase
MRPRKKLVPLAREHDVSFIAMRPFAGGRLKDAKLVLTYLQLLYINSYPEKRF